MVASLIQSTICCNVPRGEFVGVNDPSAPKYPVSQNRLEPNRSQRYSQSAEVSVSGKASHPSPRIKINPDISEGGISSAKPLQPSISANPEPYTKASTMVLSGAISCKAPPLLMSQGGSLVNNAFASTALGPPSSIRLAGFSEMTIDCPGSRM